MTQSDDQSPAKLNYRVILPIFVIVLIDLIGLSIILPLLPLYAATFGADPFIIGLVGASYPMMQFLASPILGQLSDRFGRRPVLIVSQFGTLFGFLLLGFANSLLLLFISRIIDGISGGNISTADAAVSDSTTKENRTQGLGLIGAAFGLGFILGPILALVILALTDNNYQMVAFTAAFFSLLSILLTIFWFQETLPPEARGKSGVRGRPRGLAVMLVSLRAPATGLLVALMFFQQLAFSGYENFLALFTLGRLGMNGSSNAGLFVLAGLVVVVVQGGLVGRWSKRWGNRWLILLGLSMMGIGLLMTAVTPRVVVPWYSEAALREELSVEGGSAGEGGLVSDIQVDLPDETKKGWSGLVWVALAIVPIAIGAGSIFPGVNSMLTQRVPEDQVGEILGVSAGYFSLASAISPVLLGLVYKFGGATLTFGIGGLVLVALWFFARRSPGLAE